MNRGGTVLLVEDDPTDVFLMERTFRQTEITQKLLVAQNGMEAINFLTDDNISASAGGEPFPCLILLDLKLPLKSGLEVLEWIQTQSIVKKIPVIVFTSSLDTGDIDRAYENGASGYFLKPGSLETLRQLVVLWRDYWLVHSELSYIGSDRPTPTDD